MRKAVNIGNNTVNAHIDISKEEWKAFRIKLINKNTNITKWLTQKIKEELKELHES